MNRAETNKSIFIQKISSGSPSAPRVYDYEKMFKAKH